MPTFLQDLRYGFRVLLKSPGFTAVAILTLALGIGANTAMFSVVNAVLLRPLPFRDPQQLVAIGEMDTRRGLTLPDGSVSYPDFEDVRARNHSFESIAGYNDNDYTLTGLGPALHVRTEAVSANLFHVLGTQPALGRAFLDNEDEPGHHVVILSDAFWRARFGGDHGVIGRSVGLGGREFTIVGVMPAGFQYPVLAEGRDLWTTFSRTAEVDDPADKPMTAQRGAHFLGVIARLKPGATVQQGNADLASISAALQKEYPNSDAQSGLSGQSELERMVGDTRTPLLVLFGAVGLVLLIAASNVANLLLARSSVREREIAIRAALGATRGRVIRQLIAESLILASTGAGLGIAVAVWALSALLRLYPSNLPRAQQVGIDLNALAFTAGLALVTGILFGLMPAWRVSRPNLYEVMREGGRGASSGPAHNRLRAGLVIAETALGVTLLVAAGLLIRSFDRLSHVNLGFDPGHVLTASFDLSETRYNPDQQDQFIRGLLTRLKNLPGVTAAGGAMPLPLSESGFVVTFNLVDHPVPEANSPSARFYNVAPGFFETLKIPLLRGRTFDDRDQRNSAPVMIVTEEFAKKYFPNEDPIGRRVKIGAGDGAARANYKTREIVGVVGDIRTNDLGVAPKGAYYAPLPQLMWGAPTLTIRTTGDPNAITPEVRKVLASMDPDSPLYDVRTMDDYLAMDLGRARFQTVLLGLFAGIALLLTAIGLYGVMSYAVVQRRHEIGIRVALGAVRADVLRMILGTSFAITGIGLVIGIVGASLVSRLLSSLLYEVKPMDPLTFAAVAVVLLAASTVASYIPAARAARVDPMVVLREQ